MKGLMIRLTDDERAELERRRAAGGHRSLNETVKAWLAPRAATVSITKAKGELPLVHVVSGWRVRDDDSDAPRLGRPATKPGSLLKKR